MSLLITCIFAVTACSNGGNEAANNETTAQSENGNNAPAKPADPDMVGVYRLISMTSEGENLQEDDIATLEGLGMYAMLIVDDNGKATINLFGQELEFTYDGEYFRNSTEELGYTFNKDTISLGDDKDNMTYLRMTDEEQKAAEESNELIKDMVDEFMRSEE